MRDYRVGATVLFVVGYATVILALAIAALSHG
jgi:hypothetical protein